MANQNGNSKPENSNVLVTTPDGVVLQEVELKKYPQHLKALIPGFQFQDRNNVFNHPMLTSLLSLPLEFYSVLETVPPSMDSEEYPLTRMKKDVLFFQYIVDIVVHENMFSPEINKYLLKLNIDIGKSRGPVIGYHNTMVSQDTNQPMMSTMSWATLVDGKTRSAKPFPAWWVKEHDPIAVEIPPLSRLNLEAPKDAFCRQHRVTFVCIDVNQHMTTKCYGDFCMDTIYDAIMEGQLGGVTLGDLTYCRRIKVQFLAECHMNEILDVYVWKEDTPPSGFDSSDSTFIGCMMKKEGTRAFAMMVSFKKNLEGRWPSLTPGTSTLS